jgi:DNA-binding response OmpR family regulator
MHILVVENHPIVADVHGMTLEDAGYFKTTADSIESALFELKHNQIDSVLPDLNLPDGDGTRPARLIHKTACACPFWWC